MGTRWLATTRLNLVRRARTLPEVGILLPNIPPQTYDDGATVIRKRCEIQAVAAPWGRSCCLVWVI